MVWPWFFCETAYVCPQYPYRGNDMIFWIFAIVHCHAFSMWHWPIGKDLYLSFIWDHHHLHLVGMDNQSINWLLLHRAAETQQGLNSCRPLLHDFLAFSLDSIMLFPYSAFYVVSALHRCFLVFLFLTGMIFYRSYVNRQGKSGPKMTSWGWSFL